MKIKTDDELMEINIQYADGAEFKKKALQKKILLAIKILERRGQITAKMDQIDLTVSIKCYDVKIYNQILKGYGSVT